MPETLLLAVAATLLGAVAGSFLNVVILRLPRPGASIVFPPSHCPFCKAPIRWHDNIPLFSFLLLRGRCRDCRARISWQYPLVELAMSLFSLGLFARFGISLAFAFYFLFCAGLLAIIVIDFRHQIIPDVISLPGIATGLVFSLLHPLLAWQDSLLGILAGGGVFYLVALGYYLCTRREGMGGGDIKLLAMIGAFLGWQSLPFVVLSSSLTGLAAGLWVMRSQGRGGRTVIPYGPFLAFGALLFLFFHQEILDLAGRFLVPG